MCRGWLMSPLPRSTSRCLAKVRIKAIFTSSEDWKVLPAMLIQARASTPPLPWICSPKNGGVDHQEDGKACEQVPEVGHLGVVYQGHRHGGDHPQADGQQLGAEVSRARGVVHAAQQQQAVDGNGLPAASHKSRSARFRYWIRPFPKRLIMVYGISFAGRRLPCGIGTVEGTGELPPRRIMSNHYTTGRQGLQGFCSRLFCERTGGFPGGRGKRGFRALLMLSDIL